MYKNNGTCKTFPKSKSTFNVSRYDRVCTKEKQEQINFIQNQRYYVVKINKDCIILHFDNDGKREESK